MKIYNIGTGTVCASPTFGTWLVRTKLYLNDEQNATKTYTKRDGKTPVEGVFYKSIAHATVRL